MWRLPFVLALVLAVLFAAGCEMEGQEGDLCDSTDDCNSGLVCVTQVLNCAGNDCWGTCERECAEASDCDGGDVCVRVNGGYLVCRSDAYELPGD